MGVCWFETSKDILLLRIENTRERIDECDGIGAIVRKVLNGLGCLFVLFQPLKNFFNLPSMICCEANSQWGASHHVLGALFQHGVAGCECKYNNESNRRHQYI